MKLLTWLSRRLRPSGSKPDRVPDELGSLILAAREDPEFREQLIFVLRLPRLQREPLLRTAVEEMRLRGEPVAACETFEILSTDAGAEAALRLLLES